MAAVERIVDPPPIPLNRMAPAPTQDPEGIGTTTLRQCALPSIRAIPSEPAPSHDLRTSSVLSSTQRTVLTTVRANPVSPQKPQRTYRDGNSQRKKRSQPTQSTIHEPVTDPTLTRPVTWANEIVAGAETATDADVESLMRERLRQRLSYRLGEWIQVTTSLYG